MNEDPKKLQIEDLFSSPEFWSHVMNHCVTRRVSISMLRKWCEAEYRNGVIKLIENGEYRIAPPYIGRIPKPDGGVREVFVNTDQDRIILNGVYTIYNEVYKSLVHPQCVSYTKGLGVNKISKQVLQEVQVAKQQSSAGLIGCKLDIRKYFDRVPIEVIEKWLNRIRLVPSLDRLLWEYYHDNTIRIDRETEETKEHYKSLAQGCAMSALLANLVLSQLDARMAKVCEVYYRYSDDILFYTTDMLTVAQVLSEELTAVGLEIHPDKLEILQDEFEFLGVKFTSKGRGLGTRGRSEFKQGIHELTTSTKKTCRNTAAVQSAIRKIQRKYLFPVVDSNSPERDKRQFCWAAYFFSIVDNVEDIHWADNIAKDSLRHMFTGKWNFTHNRNKLSNDMLRELGWISLVQLYKAYQLGPDVYEAEIGRIKYAQGSDCTAPNECNCAESDNSPD